MGSWENFSSERVDELVKNKTPVFINFTAEWCLTCQANHFALGTSEVNNMFSDLGVVKMRADWTKKDSSITEALQKYGRNSVPFYLLIIPQKDGIKTEVLPQILTPTIVLQHLEKVNNE